MGQVWLFEFEKVWCDGLYKNVFNIELVEEEYGCVLKKFGGVYLLWVFIEQVMVVDYLICIYCYEVLVGFESWMLEL